MITAAASATNAATTAAAQDLFREDREFEVQKGLSDSNNQIHTHARVCSPI